MFLKCLIYIALLYKVSSELILNLPNLCTRRNHYIVKGGSDFLCTTEFTLQNNDLLRACFIKLWVISIKLLTLKLKRTTKDQLARTCEGLKDLATYSR